MVRRRVRSISRCSSKHAIGRYGRFIENRYIRVKYYTSPYRNRSGIDDDAAENASFIHSREHTRV